MGVVECNSAHDIFTKLEQESLNNKFYNNVDRRIGNEYKNLIRKPSQNNQLISFSSQDESSHFEINSQLSESKRLSRFKKWYNMSYEHYKHEISQNSSKTSSGGSIESTLQSVNTYQFNKSNVSVDQSKKTNTCNNYYFIKIS